MRRVIVITSGRGPVECRRAVKGVTSAFLSDAEDLGLECDLITGNDPDGEGPVSSRIVLADGGLDAFGLISSWLGTVQWISRSDRRAKADRKNWFVGVREECLLDASQTAIDEKDVEFTAMTAGGPGGQHQNKTASAVRAVHRPTGIAVVVRSDRSQHRNKARALERIAAIIDATAAAERVDIERAEWVRRIAVERGSPIRILRQK